jgi:hypothetical protein
MIRASEPPTKLFVAPSKRAGIEFTDENGGGPGVRRLRERQSKKE